jgi:hypothetical protein
VRIRVASMSAPVKIGLIAAGYIGAFLIAFVSVALYVASTSGPDRQLYSGMYAFGDSLLFLGVFGLAAVPSTGAALFFLGPYRSFWRGLSVGALAIATTGVAALLVYLGDGRPPRSRSSIPGRRGLCSEFFLLHYSRLP